MNYKMIPYGISNYELLKSENYYFVDKTRYIEKLESQGSQYLFFLRPRRFGKTLFISLLEHYYDINMKERFEELFKDTYIGKNPTRLKSSYPILRFNLSFVKSNGPIEEIEVSFRLHVLNCIELFLGKYKHLKNIQDIDFEELKAIKDAGDILKHFLTKLQLLKVRFYLLIDEYDNFANNILIEHGKDRNEKITHAGGFLRSFFAVIKGGTESRAIDRLFITGVSPLVMADVTSGFNIGDNISGTKMFNSMLGFTRDDIERFLDYYEGKNLIKKEERKKSTQIMNEYYNNYCFSSNTTERVYNTDMVLYYVNKYLQEKEIPLNLVDDNIRTDYGKLRYLIVMDNKLNGNFSILKEMLNEQVLSAKLVTSFSIGDIIDRRKFTSLLYYLGLTTIKNHQGSGFFDFEIPNRAIEGMFWDYIRESMNDVYGELKIDTFDLERFLMNMARKGEWEDFFNYVTGKFYEACSIRDFTFHEEGIKLFLLAYLNLLPLFRVHSEPEMNKGYADIWLEKDTLTSEITKYSYIIELKYIKADELKKDSNAVDAAYGEAEKQILKYIQDKKIVSGDADSLIKIIIILSSNKLERMVKI
ncbi:MAG: AAA family ATPase [bacterium]|nr:AAA family ATPase [bacterium]